MTVTTNTTEAVPKPDDEPTRAEIEAFRRDMVLANPAATTPDQYPRLWNVSAGHIYRAVVRPTLPESPEYVSVRLQPGRRNLELSLTVTNWNLLWEAAQLRRHLFDERELPLPLRKIAEKGDINLVFIPRSRSRYYEYAPLFHLLPRRTLEQFGLPLVARGQWPFFTEFVPVDNYLPNDFAARLSRAWAATIWPHIMPQSSMTAFSPSDSLKVLAHNLDFWIPPVTAAIENILRDFPTVDKSVVEGPPPLDDGGFLEDALMGNPRMGGDVWRGEEEAAEVLSSVIAHADASCHLRGVLEAIRSGRVEEDFSRHWSYAREDFARKLYHKRSKITVKFVELTDTIPVHGPESEVIGNMVTSDFLALLDPKDRQVVVLLSSGVTKLGDIANTMGYSSHSAVSKRLKRIRLKAAQFFNEDRS